MKKSVVAYLSDLIRIPSPSALSNLPIIRYAGAVLAAAGWQTQEFPYRDSHGIEKVNLIAAPLHQQMNTKQVDLACVCHTDTVPFHPGWLKALEPCEESSHIFGCGACDVKGFLACLLAAASAIDSSKIKQEVRLVLTADEEVGCIGARHLIEAGMIEPRRMVIGEPTSLRPAIAGKGYALAEITVHGAEAHSALPDEGASAVYAAARLITAIEDYAAEISAETSDLFTPPYTTLNVGVVQGGTAKNIIAGTCRFLVEWRPIPGQNPDAVFRKLRQLAAEIERQRPRIRVDAALLRQQAGFQSSANDPLVALTTSYCHTGTASIAFGSEASLFAAEGREIIVFGPGSMEYAHSDRERVPIAELQVADEYLRQLLVLAAF